ncbi:zinc finger protein 883-like [Anopheles nili]|uniref:zinc finger protein 883-like n=1 Tax=Anopheles nili TaxID=185578 RepID=UPI00237C434A|nr:zinc finger protein 883-like [Anopheles nili]
MLLYNAKVCRLCCDVNENGLPLKGLNHNSGECEISKLINQYLPVKVNDDGILPRWICPGCHIQLESTAQFFERIFKGQEQLVALKQQQEVLGGSIYDSSNQTNLHDFCEESNHTIFDDQIEIEPSLVQNLEDLPKPNGSAPMLVKQDTIAKDGKCDKKDLIVQSEEIKSSGRIIGFVHHNRSKTDMGNLVLVDNEDGTHQLGAVFMCDICSETFAQETRYLKHRKTHRMLFECSNCLVRFSSDGKLVMHQQETLHVGKGIIEGLLLTENNKNERKSHGTKLSTEAPNTTQRDGKEDTNLYACDSCDSTFTQLSHVLNHEESAHAHENLSFICIECGKAFKQKNLLHRHQYTHVEERPHQCDVCEAAFKTRSTLLKHARIHATDKKRYQCTMCSQQFAYKTSLHQHVNWHNGVKPFACDQCSKRFSQRGNLKEHQRVHSGDKPFECHICEAWFSTSSQHRQHVQRHDNVRTHACDLCDKKFSSSENFKAHLRRHRNEKPFACENCPRTFVERSALKKHVRAHTQEKPYSCKRCKKAFSDCSNLTRHVSNVHDKRSNSKPDREETYPAEIPNDLHVVINDTTLFDIDVDSVIAS